MHASSDGALRLSLEMRVGMAPGPTRRSKGQHALRAKCHAGGGPWLERRARPQWRGDWRRLSAVERGYISRKAICARIPAI